MDRDLVAAKLESLRRCVDRIAARRLLPRRPSIGILSIKSAVATWMISGSLPRPSQRSVPLPNGPDSKKRPSLIASVLVATARSRPSSSEQIDLRTSVLLPHPLRQFFIDRSPVTNGHEANGSRLLIDGVDDPKASNAILSEAFQFSAEWYATGGIGGDRADGSFDRLFKVGME